MIPFDGDGEFTMILKFSEIYFTQPGEKIFDVKIGSKFIAKKLDIFGSLLSKMLPLDVFVGIKIKGGKLFIEVIKFMLMLSIGRRSIKRNKEEQDHC